MADITRTGTDLKGNSDPGRAVRPANDYHGKNITMAVDVQAGQWVAINTANKGVLADASTGQNQRVVGMATEKKPAGQRVHCMRWGLSAGFSFPGGSPGDPVYLSNTAGEASTTPGDVPLMLGFRDADEGIFVDLGMGLAVTSAALSVAALTDSSGGAAADGTIAANEAQSVIAIPVTLVAVTGAMDVLTNYIPGFKGTILKVSSYVKVPVTTGAKLATFTPRIGATPVTGGVVALTSALATPLGKVNDGTAVTAANVFTATDAISIAASAVTAFAEGEVVFLITVASDTADDNNKDFATEVNAILTAMKNAGLMAA